MKKRFTLGTVLALMLLVAVATGVISYSMVFQKLHQDFELSKSQRQEFSKFIEARNIVQRNFVGTVDDEVLLDGAIKGMVDALGDRYSHYLDAEEYDLYNRRTENKYIGIGISASMSPEGDILVNEVFDKSPAQQCHIMPQDRIVAIEDQKVVDMSYQMAVASLAGEENTKVRITVLKASDGQTMDVAPLRKKLDTQAVYSEILTGQNIGYIHIRNFDTNVDRDFKEAINHLVNAKVGAIIFDVRNNPGGQLDVMCPMLDTLLPEGVLITMREKNGNEFQRTSAADSVDIPMAVLINSHSYSAAEFFAAALQEYEKAVLVGEKTTGKGYAQYPIRMEDKSAIILSTMEYFTPKGKSLSGVGLQPDYEVVLSPDDLNQSGTLTHEQDKQLQKAISVLVSQMAPPSAPTEEPSPSAP